MGKINISSECSKLVLGIIFFSGIIAAETYYVSNTGKNTNPGTKEKPWATPGYGSRRIKPGDTLIITKGRYILSKYDEDIITPPSGRPGAWITIKGQNADQSPVLAGKNNLAYTIHLSNVSHVKIENLEITSDDGAVLRDGITAIDRPVSHIVFNNLYIHHLNEFGMNLKDVKHVLVFNTKIDYCGFGSIGGPKAKSGGWQHVVIKDCSLSYSGHFYSGKKNPYDRPDGFGIEPSRGPVEIVNSTAEHNRGDGLDSKAKNTYIHECVVANNRCDGIKLWGSGSKIENCLIYGRGDGNTQAAPWAAIVIDSEKPGRFEISNTTVDDFMGKNYIMYVQYDTPNIPINLNIKNSIFNARGENSPIFLARAVDYEILSTLFYFPKNDSVLIHGGIREYKAGQISLLGPGNIYGDPLFLSPAFGKSGDYHVKRNSKAVDNGTVSKKGLSVIDLDGNRRNSDGNNDRIPRVDMGAYEYGSESIKPGLSCLFYPAGKISDLRSEFIWTAVDNSAHYRLRIKQGTKFIMNKRRYKTSAVNKNGICSIRLPIRLLPGKKYSWRVKAMNRNGKGKWSPNKRFYVKND